MSPNANTSNVICQYLYADPRERFLTTEETLSGLLDTVQSPMKFPVLTIIIQITVYTQHFVEKVRMAQRNSRLALKIRLSEAEEKGHLQLLP